MLIVVTNKEDIKSGLKEGEQILLNTGHIVSIEPFYGGSKITMSVIETTDGALGTHRPVRYYVKETLLEISRKIHI